MEPLGNDCYVCTGIVKHDHSACTKNLYNYSDFCTRAKMLVLVALLQFFQRLYDRFVEAIVYKICGLEMAGTVSFQVSLFREYVHL